MDNATHSTDATTDPRRPELREAHLADIAVRDLPRPDMVTSVIRQRVKSVSIEAYEAWLHRIIPIAGRFPGHRGTHVLRPPVGSTEYTITVHFDTLAHAEDWFRSEARRTLLDEAKDFLATVEEVNTVTGLEFWFMPPAGRTAPRPAKQFLVTLSAIFPLSTMVPPLVMPVFESLPLPWGFLASHFVSAAIVVGLMTYVVMPRFTRLLSRWLYR